MVTKQDCVMAGTKFGRTEFHVGDCTKTIGKRGSIKFKIEVWRSNGKCQVWKTRPEDFSLPIKYGYKGPYTYITPWNMNQFHLSSECKPKEIKL